MDRETFNDEVQQARTEGDMDRMQELERMEAEGRVGDDRADGPPDVDEAFENEVEHARRAGDAERLEELERAEANGNRADALKGSHRLHVRLDAAIAEAEEAEDTRLANQLHSIREADDPAAALDAAKKAATGERYETLKELAGE